MKRRINFCELSGDENHQENSSDTAIMDLTEEDVNMLVCDDSDKKLTPQFRSQAPRVEPTGPSFIDEPATSEPSNP